MGEDMGVGIGEETYGCLHSRFLFEAREDLDLFVDYDTVYYLAAGDTGE